MEGANSIGLFYPIFEFYVYVSILTNSAIIALISTQLESYVSKGLSQQLLEGSNRVWAAVVIEHALLLIKIFIGYLIPDNTKQVKAELAKRDFLGRWLQLDSKGRRKAGVFRRPPPLAEVSDVEDWGTVSQPSQKN